MAKIAYFDCSYGVAGDMILGALVDAGCPFGDLKRGIESGLGVHGLRLSRRRVMRAGVSATRVQVHVDHDHDHHRHLADVLRIVDGADLPDRAKENARQAYRLLAAAEAKVHRTTPEKIHFHEVGCLDAIADVAGGMLALDLLGIERVEVSPIALGSGSARCAHGVIPVPAPATVELLRGVPTFGGGFTMEMATPTGAAILRAVAAGHGSQPPMTIEATGYGSGKREIEGHANFLRVMVGQGPAAIPASGKGAAASEGDVHTMPLSLLMCEIDDMNPELLGALLESLFEAGCLDAHFTAVQMKKNRPGTQVQVLCRREDSGRFAAHLLRHSSTFGVKVVEVGRMCLPRRAESVETALGPVDVKVGLWEGEVLKVTAEYESCRRIARSRELPLGEVYRVAQAAIDKRYFARKRAARGGKSK